MFTDVVLVGSNDVRETAEELGLKLHSVDAGRETWLKSELPGACRAISKALDGDGCVLVYSESETKASLVVCAYRECMSVFFTCHTSEQRLQSWLRDMSHRKSLLKPFKDVSNHTGRMVYVTHL